MRDHQLDLFSSRMVDNLEAQVTLLQELLKLNPNKLQKIKIFGDNLAMVLAYLEALHLFMGLSKENSEKICFAVRDAIEQETSEVMKRMLEGLNE